jgi:hypothetical protein
MTVPLKMTVPLTLKRRQCVYLATCCADDLFDAQFVDHQRVGDQ